jgi:hypothetical protein
MATTVDSDIEEEADGDGNDVFPAFFRPNFMDRVYETAVRMRSQLRMAWHGMRLTLHSRRRADGRSMAVLMIRRRAKKRAEVLFHFVLVRLLLTLLGIPDTLVGIDLLVVRLSH